MSDEKHRQRLQSSSSPHSKKTKKSKKRKKVSVSTSPPDDTVKPQTPPETEWVSTLPPVHPVDQQSEVRPTCKKDRQFTGSGHRSKTHPTDSPVELIPSMSIHGCGGQAQGCMPELSVQVRESLRWEGVLEDPQAEEQRLELYRTNRRQRYITHRETLQKQTLDNLRHVCK